MKWCTIQCMAQCTTWCTRQYTMYCMKGVGDVWIDARGDIRDDMSDLMIGDDKELQHGIQADDDITTETMLRTMRPTDTGTNRYLRHNHVNLVIPWQTYDGIAIHRESRTIQHRQTTWWIDYQRTWQYRTHRIQRPMTNADITYWTKDMSRNDRSMKEEWLWHQRTYV